MFGPSDRASSGFGCTSIKNPSTPAPAAAQASGSTNSRCPLDCVPPPPGNCTLCVASNTTGYPKAAQNRERPHIDDQIVIPE